MKSPNLIRVTALFLAVLAYSISPALAATFFTINYPGASATTPYGINDVGQIVGTYSDVNGVIHGFVWILGSFTTIDVPGSPQTQARGINRRGDIVGIYRGTDGFDHGFLLSDGAFTTIDVPAASNTMLHGINDRGQIVGQYIGTGIHGFVFDRGSFTEIAHTGGLTAPFGINLSGQITGVFGNGGNENQGFLLSKNAFSTFDFPSAEYTVAFGINSQGEIVGEYATTSTTWGFLRAKDGATFTQIVYPSGADPTRSTSAFGINRFGVIVGSYNTEGNFSSQGFVMLP